MKRKIIHIDRDRCNGCGACARACHEGAIEMVDGRAKLMREDYCDGFGDCLPKCPAGAITYEEREALVYDPEAVRRSKQRKALGLDNDLQHEGCPGTRTHIMSQSAMQKKDDRANILSALAQWPCQIKLVSPAAPYFSGCHLLIAADCTAYAYAEIHRDFMRERITVVGCPKLDSIDYSEKLTEIFTRNRILDITLLRMEVPCCGGLVQMTEKAILQSGKQIALSIVTIAIDGTLINE